MGLGRILAFWKWGRANASVNWTEDDVLLFLQGGGRFAPGDFNRMDLESRQRVAATGRAFLADIVATLARAIHDPETASRLGAAVDGGAMREGDVMIAALQGVGRKILEGRR